MRSQVTIFPTLVSNNPTLWTTKKKHRLALAFRTLFRGEGGVLSLKGLGSKLGRTKIRKARQLRGLV